MPNLGLTELIIILVIVALIFGTKKLRSMGSDLGGAVKGFQGALKSDNKQEDVEKDDTATATVEKTQEEK